MVYHILYAAKEAAYKLPELLQIALPKPRPPYYPIPSLNPFNLPPEVRVVGTLGTVAVIIALALGIHYREKHKPTPTEIQ